MLRKVGFAINSFEGGGAERILGYVINTLDRKRFSPFLCLLLSPGQGYDLAEDVPVYFSKKARLPILLRIAATGFSALFAMPFFYSPKRCMATFSHSRQVVGELISCCLGLKTILARERPEALVVFLQQSIIITLLTLILFRIRVPVVCSDRVFVGPELEGYRFPRLNRLIMKLLYRRIDVYLAVSEGIKQDMVLRFGIPASRVVTVYNGCDRDLVMRRAREPLSGVEQKLFPPDDMVVITVGRLMEQKGHEDLLKAFALLHQRLPCRLILVGEGDKLDDLMRLADNLKITHRVDFVGWSDNPFKLIAAADVFVLSSRYEGFPNVLLEAMALGKPIVSTDCPTGPSEILDQGRFGMLVPPADPEALAKALQMVCTDEVLRSEFQTLSRRRSEDFTLEKMVSSYESILESLPALRSSC